MDRRPEMVTVLDTETDAHMTSIIPLDSLAQRIPIVAKLKAGAMKGNRPTTLETWRATTSSERWAQHFADRYGGEVKEFPNPSSPHKWEVFSETDEVAIALLDDGFSLNYELWSGGGCQRRCDGVTAEVLQTTGPNDVEFVESPCICDRKQALECSLKSRLTFVMPDLPFSGGCVYESKSKNFAQEAQGMVRLIQQMQAQGIQRGVLRLEQRKSTGNRKFTIAVVSVTDSLDAIASGENTRALGTAPKPSPELSSPPPEDAVEEGESVPPPRADSPEHSDDDTVYDAEVVEDDEPAFRLDPAERAKMRAAFMARTQSDLGLDYETQVKPWLIAKYGGGWSELSDDQALSLYNALVVPDGSRAEKEDAGQRFKKAVLDEVAA